MTDDEEDAPLTVDFRIPEVAATWASQADVKRPWRTQVRARIAELVAGARTILELGPGPGWLAEAILSRNVVERYTLFDFAPPFLDMCRARLASYPCEYVVGDFRSAGWDASLGTYDAIVAMQSVHEIRHRRHIPRLFAELRPHVRETMIVCEHVWQTSEPLKPITVPEDFCRDAFLAAGFARVTIERIENLYLCVAKTSK